MALKATRVLSWEHAKELTFKEASAVSWLALRQARNPWPQRYVHDPELILTVILLDHLIFAIFFFTTFTGFGSGGLAAKTMNFPSLDQWKSSTSVSDLVSCQASPPSGEDDPDLLICGLAVTSGVFLLCVLRLFFFFGRGRRFDGTEFSFGGEGNPMSIG